RVKRVLIFDFRFLIALLLTPLMGGCGAVGVAAYKLSPPPTIEAQYVLPRVPTLVMVENYHDAAATRADAETLSRFIYEDLRAARIESKEQHKQIELAPLVDWKKIYDLRSQEPDRFNTMKITDIGRELGAEQVIYVDLIYSEVQEMMGSDMMRG